ncbi:MAG TPA: hypothetical protein ENI55_03120 [Alphaproteobacteria bacterium]|nr:hypothetical protein [Alphaproteobacteria bacterium]
MADASTISGQSLIRLAPSADGYRASRDVRTRAAVTKSDETIHNRRALKRLDLILKAGRPLRDEVPRGYYLDLKV